MLCFNLSGHDFVCVRVCVCGLNLFIYLLMLYSTSAECVAWVRRERETIIISMRYKDTVPKSSVTCDHQTGLTKNAWVGMAKKYTNKKQVNMHACTLSTKKKLVGGGRKPFTAISSHKYPLRSCYTIL